MVIQGFAGIRHTPLTIELLNMKKCSKVEKLGVLRNCKIGIDVHYWVKMIIFKNVEPFAIVMGGVPCTFTRLVKDEIEKFRKAGIIPFFVFNGLNSYQDSARGSKFPIEVNKKQSDMKIGWTSYHTNDMNTATLAFSCFSRNFDYERVLIDILFDAGVEYLVSPYNAMAQLAWFSLEKPFIHAIYGGEETLLFNISKLINFINFDDEAFFYIDKKEMLSAFEMNDDQFIDTAIIAGNCFSRAPLVIEGWTHNKFSQTIVLISNHSSSIDALLSIGGDLKEFSRARSVISHHVVYTNKCSTFIMNIKKAPLDLIQVMGKKLPDELLFFVSIGMIGTDILNGLVTGTFVEPVVYYDFGAYKSNAFKQIVRYRTVATSLLSKHLDVKFQGKIGIMRYNACDIKETMEPFEIKTGQGVFHIVEKFLLEKLTSEKKSRADLHFVANHIVKGEKELLITSSMETMPYVLVKSLEHLGYYDDGALNKFGIALKHAALYPEQTLLLIELARADLFNSRTYGTVTFGNDAEKQAEKDAILIISKVFSLLPMKLSETAWSGPLSLVLTQFHVLSSSFSSNIRNIFEMTYVDAVLSGKVTLKNASLSPIAKRLPFLRDISISMGIVSEFLLEKDITKDVLKQIPSKFPNCLDPLGDIKTGVAFWNQTVKIFKTHLVEFSTLNNELELADAFLQKRMSGLK